MKGGLYKAVTEDWLNRFDELRVTDSTLNEGTLARATSESGRRNDSLGHRLTGVVAQTSAIKPPMAGTQKQWGWFPPSSVY